MASRSLSLARMAVLLAAFSALAVAPHPAAAQLQFSSPDGKMTLKLGLLGQLQAESIETANAQDSSNNIFLRRFRLMANFKLSDKLTVFVETDNPNLGKGNADGSKNNVDIFIQDAVITYTFSKAFQLDGGMLLLGQTYNHGQSAATLMALDFGPYSFNESVPTTSRTGRDYGVQARGYLADDHFEYRAGVFQGLRGVNNTNPFRYSGRLVYYVFGPQTSYFYRGTSLGTIKTLSIGAAFDRQKDYKSVGGDFYWDQPVTGGDGVTVQADYQKLDGDVFITALPKQTLTLAEVGYYFHSVHLQPYLQLARQDFDAAFRPDEKRTQAGLGYYLSGHNSNLKVAWTKIDRDGAKKRNQYQIQYQVFAF